jgi:putative oxygen-independent coproporphyrinogen III oxidase
MASRPVPVPLGLYIHLPWCVRKCPYCDFNSHALQGELPAQAYVEALLADLDAQAPWAHGRPIESVFLGGGTPSLFPPESIARLLEEARARLTIDPDAEITLEANPGTVEQARFEAFRAAGINRLSIGIQSFEQSKLQLLGRIHGREEALAAAQAARAAGFENFNLDLMFGLPEQDLAGARADLEQAIALQPTHISYYQLTLEPNTIFHRRPPALPDDELIGQMQFDGQAMLQAHGYTQYEVSAYARPGHRCLHNLNYWRFGDYLAIGAGAHGKISAPEGILRYRKPKLPRSYQEQPARMAEQWRLTPADVMLEFLMNALRLNEGFAIPLCEARTGLRWCAFEEPVHAALAQGLLEQEGQQVRASATGRRYLNDLLELFLPEQSVE